MHDPLSMANSKFLAMTDIVQQQCLEELYGMGWYDPTCYAMEILDAKYEAISTDEVVNICTHLDDEQNAELKQVLKGFQKLFSGKLGTYPHQKFHIDIEPEAWPKHVRPYLIPRIHRAAFKKELEHLNLVYCHLRV